jgi:hypothetical protein
MRLSAENGHCDFFDARFYIFSYSCTSDDIFVGSVNLSMCVYQGVTKRCHLSWLTNYALVYEPKCMGMGGVARSQLMSTAVHRSQNKLWRSNSTFNLRCIE